MNEPTPHTFADLHVGQSAQFEVTINEEMVSRFADLSGDHNPLHTDEGYSATTPLGARVAHGMLVASFFSQLVGMHLPGRNSLYLSQALNFRAPCYIGTSIRIQGEITSVSTATRTVTLRTRALLRDSGECLIDGEAMVRLLV